MKKQCDWNEKDVMWGDHMTCFLVTTFEAIKHNDCSNDFNEYND